MYESRLFSVLKLAYSPLSNYDFTIVRDDKIIINSINSTKLYVIAQRPVLTIEGFRIDDEDSNNLVAKFEIHQQGNEARLVCAVPLFQDSFEIPPGSQSKIAINYIYPKSQSDVQEQMPFTNMANFVIANSGGDFFWL